MATKQKQKNNAELFDEVSSELHCTGVISVNFRDLILRDLSCIAFPIQYTDEKKAVKFSDERYINLERELDRSTVISGGFKRFIMGYALALNHNVHRKYK